VPRTYFLNLALNIAFNLVGMSSSLHGGVSSGGSDSLLNVSLDFVSDTLGVGLGIRGSLGGIGLSLLGGTVRSKVRVSEGLANGLLSASDVGVGSVLDTLSHFLEVVVGCFGVCGEEMEFLLVGLC